MSSFRPRRESHMSDDSESSGGQQAALDSNFNEIPLVPLPSSSGSGSGAAGLDAADFTSTRLVPKPHLSTESASPNKVALNQTNAFMDGGLWQAVWEGNMAGTQQWSQEPVAPGSVYTRGEFERGAEGETILHLAVLRKHTDLAFWIIDRFPSLINETYVKHKYYGETPLHIAVVNCGLPRTAENPDAPNDISIVKRLVERGALVNGPLVSGTEFLKDSDKGVLYFGQTILQFAAANGKTAAVKYLVENPHDPADLTVVDIYGNNVLHVMAYHGNFDVELFGYLKRKNMLSRRIAKRNGQDCPVDISKARNKEHLTAYQVGISRGHVKALEAMKDIIWEFGVVRQYRICLDDLDPLQPHQDKKESLREQFKDGSKALERYSKSAIEIAVENQDKEILSHPLMESILKIKWALYGRAEFLWRLGLTAFLVICITVTISLQPDTLEARRNYSFSDENRHPIPRLVFESLSIAGTVIMILGELEELRIQGIEYVRGYGSMENNVQWLFAIMIWTIPLVRWGIAAATGTSGYDTLVDVENVMFGFCAIWGWFYLLEFSKGFEKLGPLLLIFKRMILTDFVAWLVPYVVLTIGFASALFLQMQHVPYLTTKEFVPSYDWNQLAGAVVWTIRYIFMKDWFDDFRFAEIPAFTEFLYVLYMFVTQVVLFNVLIAMLAETLKSIAKDSERTWRVQFASLLIQIDESMSDSKHKHILSHLGWTHEDEEELERRELIEDGLAVSSESFKSKIKRSATERKSKSATASRYFIFTERDTVKIDPHTKKRTVKTETLKLIVAKDAKGGEIEVRTDKDHWFGWTRDVMKTIWSGGSSNAEEGGWWKSHSFRVNHSEKHFTVYQHVNRAMRAKVEEKLSVAAAAHDKEVIVYE
ncbi:hypothetical protein BCR33DRAFT_851044 [Rhizoclosmatium globosum]|uniref:Uncharacterized protein n=1 Tax=Rhizoclosmatium globosum TaxID=329046 RepID=A0A1Y2C8A9_9FUNG|nr:hypothetical protein BCR33DRAFT_851044 [Rhizoclosmatium globosum]|eukprot:ORY43270.1 hypothetical protein BCR33DRAFT_851044 [Rhizoclosmatium globosum]